MRERESMKYTEVISEDVKRDYLLLKLIVPKDFHNT